MVYILITLSQRINHVFKKSLHMIPLWNLSHMGIVNYTKSYYALLLSNFKSAPKTLTWCGIIQGTYMPYLIWIYFSGFI